MNFKQLPLYRIVVDLDDEESKMTAISLVDQPAIEKDFIAFDKQERINFSVADEQEHKVFGPAIICDLPIYRIDPVRGEYMVVFDREAIDNIILKYSKQGLNNLVDLQHDGEMVDGVTMVEYFQKNSEKGITPKGYDDVSDYSLFVTYKVEDEELWQRIVSEESDLKGFSIEISAGLELTDQTVDDGEEEFDDIWEWLANALGFATQKKKLIDAIESAIDDNNELTVKMTGGRSYTGFGYTTWTSEGSTNLALWDGKEWRVLNVNNIADVSSSNTLTKPDWSKAAQHPDFNWINKELNNPNTSNINKVATAPKSEYERAIIEHKWANITYNDETGNPCLGARQCLVMESGWTTNENKALRVYETFGATHSEEGVPGWRTLRIDRITSFKIIEFLEPATSAPEGFRPIGAGQDKDGFVCDLRSDLV